MKAKKARNKPYRPKKSLPGGGLQALVRIEDRARFSAINNATYQPEDLTELRAAYWIAFANLKTGHATAEAWGHVCFSLNLTMVLCEQGFGEEWIDTVTAALKGMFKAQLRGEKNGTFGLDGPAIQAISDALEVHDQQMELVTRAETANAYNIVQQRIAKGNVYKIEQVH